MADLSMVIEGFRIAYIWQFPNVPIGESQIVRMMATLGHVGCHNWEGIGQVQGIGFSDDELLDAACLFTFRWVWIKRETINQLSICLLGVLGFRSLDLVICHPIILQWCPPMVNSPGIHLPGLT